MREIFLKFSRIKKIPDKLKNKRYIGFVLVLIILILIAGGITSFYFLNQNSLFQSKNNEQSSLEQSQKLIDKIGRLIEIPSNEEPILATVSDVNQLSNESFYENAQNGDKVLIYKTSKTAILYRPSINKIIKVGSVTIDVNNPESSASVEKVIEGLDASSLKVSVAIYNGTNIRGLADNTGSDLKAKFENLKVVDMGNASRDYTKTLIVDLSALPRRQAGDKAGLSGKNKSAAKTLAEELDGEVGELPEGETVPVGADILIILGNAQ